MYVIRNKQTKDFVTTKYSRFCLVNDINEARTYKTKRAASCSITNAYENHFYYEILEVEIKLIENEPLENL